MFVANNNNNNNNNNVFLYVIEHLHVCLEEFEDQVEKFNDFTLGLETAIRASKCFTKQIQNLYFK